MSILHSSMIYDLAIGLKLEYKTKRKIRFFKVMEQSVPRGP